MRILCTEWYLRFLTKAEVSNFRLRNFEKVVPFWGQNGADIYINTIQSYSNYRSNETGDFGGFLKSFVRLENHDNLNFCVFHPIWSNLL